MPSSNDTQPDSIRNSDGPKQVAVVRFSGDISTKSRQTRKRFIRKLVRNIKAALRSADIPCEVSRAKNRIDIFTHNPECVDVIRRVFGVQGVGLAEVHPWRSIDDIVRIGHTLFQDAVRGRIFAVRARRLGHKHLFPFSSMDVERQLGTVLEGAGVNLKTPEVWVRAEVRPDEVLFYTQPEAKGYGGLPIGVQGRALTLISGGFDSAVASWHLLKRGVAQDYVFFNLGGAAHVRGARTVLRTLALRWSHGTRPKLYLADLRPLVTQMREVVPGTYWQVLLKRVMARAADLLARTMGYEALITGESLGQVSSQALGTLVPVAVSVESEILRPLIGYNKDTIIEQAKEIGTHDVSAGVPEFCALGGGRPVTRIGRDKLDKLETRLDAALLESIVESCEVVPATEAYDDELEGVETSEIPDEAIVIDLREPAEFAAWHLDGARNVPFVDAVREARSQERGPTYLLCCKVGIQSAYLALEMRAMGLAALSFSGGVRALRASLG